MKQISRFSILFRSSPRQPNQLHFYFSQSVAPPPPNCPSTHASGCTCCSCCCCGCTVVAVGNCIWGCCTVAGNCSCSCSSDCCAPKPEKSGFLQNQLDLILKYQVRVGRLVFQELYEVKQTSCNSMRSCFLFVDKTNIGSINKLL